MYISAHARSVQTDFDEGYLYVQTGLTQHLYIQFSRRDVILYVEMDINEKLYIHLVRVMSILYVEICSFIHLYIQICDQSLQFQILTADKQRDGVEHFGVVADKALLREADAAAVAREDHVDGKAAVEECQKVQQTLEPFALRITVKTDDCEAFALLDLSIRRIRRDLRGSRCRGMGPGRLSVGGRRTGRRARYRRPGRRTNSRSCTGRRRTNSRRT